MVGRLDHILLMVIPPPFSILCCALLNFSGPTGGREEVCEALLTRCLLGSLPIHGANALQFQSGMQKFTATAMSCYSPSHLFPGLIRAFKCFHPCSELLSALQTSTLHWI